MGDQDADELSFHRPREPLYVPVRWAMLVTRLQDLDTAMRPYARRAAASDSDELCLSRQEVVVLGKDLP